MTAGIAAPNRDHHTSTITDMQVKLFFYPIVYAVHFQQNNENL